MCAASEDFYLAAHTSPPAEDDNKDALRPVRTLLNSQKGALVTSPGEQPVRVLEQAGDFRHPRPTPTPTATRVASVAVSFQNALSTIPRSKKCSLTLAPPWIFSSPACPLVSS